MNLRSVLSAEARLLLTTASSRFAADDARRLLETGISWPEFFELALRERSLPPAWRRLEPLVEDRMSPEARDLLDRVAANRELYLEALHRRLVQALGVLTESGVDVLLLKGAALGHSAYSDYMERPMNDLDLLVAPEAARQAWSILRSEGWSWDEKEYPAELYRTMHHLPPLVDRRGSGAVLEVHSDVFVPGHDFRFGPEDLWHRASEIRIDGQSALIPHPVPHLLYVCLHFAWSHRLTRGTWKTFRDLDVLARQSGFDWHEFATMAGDSGGARFVYWTLWLSSELVGLEVPDEVLAGLKPRLPRPVRDRLARHFALDLLATEAGCPSVLLRNLLWRIGVHPKGDERRSWPAVPQERDEVTTAPVLEDEPPTRRWTSKLRRHLGNRGAWSDYLRGVLTGTPP